MRVTLILVSAVTIFNIAIADANAEADAHAHAHAHAYPYPHPHAAVRSGSIRKPFSRHPQSYKAPRSYSALRAMYERRAEERKIEHNLSDEGWLLKPKEKRKSASKNVIIKKDKSGTCGHPSDYGIKCGFPLNQCKEDSNCPGVTKCCDVADCGLLCVKPKLASSKVFKRRTRDKAPRPETVTNAEGLKLEDITYVLF